MKIPLLVVVVLVVVWLGLWAANVGLLVFSASTKVPATRECRYLVGVSVVTNYAVLSEHCALISRTR